MGALGWSWVELLWLLSTLAIGIAGGVTLLWPEGAEAISDLVRYGVTASDRRSRLHRLIEVPKRWFVHFYVVATATSSVAFAAVLMAYFYGIPTSKEIRWWLETMGGASPRHRFSSSPASVWIASLLLFIHSLRRLLETVFTSVYSDTTMNLLHYALGMLHYTALPVAVLSRAPGFAPAVAVTRPELASLSLRECSGALIFVLASIAQHYSLSQLAALRKSSSGNVNTYAHGVVTEGLFHWVSCPHFLCEVLVYFGLFLLLGPRHPSAQALLLFVASNQTIAALITHRWYRQRFPGTVAQRRKAIFPYLL